MKKLVVTAVLFFLSESVLLAQGSSGFSGTGSNIDVKYHRFTWTIDPDVAKKLSGSVTTYFVTTQNNVNAINFDFNKSSFNNGNLSVSYHGVAVTASFPSSGNVNILNITLPSALAINKLDSVTIFYSGAPPAVNGQAEGYQQKSIAGMGNFVYTLSESYEDKDWWPCKADMQDKIDSIDFIITTPAAFTAAANGVLKSTVISGSNKIYTFKHRHPIASYLVAVAVAKYTVFDRGTVNINGTNMPVVYYIFTGRGASATQLTAMDFCKQELVEFSKKFGDYGFKDEKYGMYEFGWSGGMEHQTFSAMDYSAMGSWSVIAHELGHQWFGDKVTFATWNHLWLAEGFASYCEALAAELIPALGKSAVTQRSGFKTKANNATNRNYSCYLPDATIANSNVLWNSNYGTTVYARGAMVVSMLRILLGDAKFFQACKNYLSDPLLAYRSATTADLQRHMEAVASGYDLTPFFNSWVYGNGYPDYNTVNAVQWYPSGTKIIINVVGQTKSTGSNVGYYYTPIPLRVEGAGGKDTIIVVYDQNGKLSKGGNGISAPVNNNILFELGFTPTSVSFDPYNMSLANGAAPLKIFLLDLNVISFSVNQNNKVNNALLTLDGNSINSDVVLERSADGIHFSELGIMQLQANSKSSKKYFLQDDQPLPVSNFYRAKFKNIDGAYKYSKIIKISGIVKNGFSIINNPVSGNIKLQANGYTNPGSHFNFQVYDLSGKKLLSIDKQINSSVTEIETGSLQKGAYILKISGSESLEDAIKFVVN